MKKTIKGFSILFLAAIVTIFGLKIASATTPCVTEEGYNDFTMWIWGGSERGRPEVSTARDSLYSVFISDLLNSPIIPVPDDCQSFTYSPETLPVLSEDITQAKPIGIGTVAAGGDTLSITLNTYQFSGPVDIYFGLYSPEIDPDNIYLLTTDGVFQELSDEAAPWKADITGPLNETLFSDIQVSNLPIGSYYLYLLVTPSGNLTNYYLWETTFSSCNSLSFTPEGTTLFCDSVTRSLELGTSEQITLLTTACGNSVTVSSVTKTLGGEWLSADPGGGSKVILNLNAGASDVQAGSTYTGLVRVAAGGIIDDTYVTLQIPEQGDATSTSVNPSSLDFYAYVGWENPKAQTISVKDNYGNPVSATVLSKPDWLLLNETGTGEFSVSCNNSYLTKVSSYSGTIYLRDDECSQQLAVSVILKVDDSPTTVTSEHQGFYDIGGGQVRYFKFVTGILDCVNPVQIANAPMADQPRTVHVLIKRGSRPTISEFEMTWGMGPSDYDCTLGQWIPAKPSSAKDLYWKYNIGPQAEFVEIGEPMESDTFYIMLYNNGTRIVLHQRLTVSY
jgi:hypothetical protein